MSYLNATRLHFAGQFRADVSTVNNDDTHFNNANFTANDQDYGAGTTNGWWQPSGTGAWRLGACAVTAAAWDGNFVTSNTGDPVVGMALKNTSDRVDAKLVDLDPDQQMVSMIFGLEIRIADPATGAVLMTGQFTPAPFMDVWPRAGSGGGDTGLSVFYQSTLTDVVWGDLSASPALQALQAASEPGMLSVRFMLDGYHMGSTKRGYGRIVGTIGPALAGEPAHFVAGRQLAGVGAFGNVACKTDAIGSTVLIDLGNALPMDTNGNIVGVGDIHLIAYGTVMGTDGFSAANAVDLGSIAGYQAAGYYTNRAGIQALPASGNFTTAQAQALLTQPLAIATFASGRWTPLAIEAPDGIFARADMFVARMNPGDTQKLPIMVTQFGLPSPYRTVTPTISSNSIGTGVFPVSTPTSALQMTMSGVTGDDGWTTLTLTASDPGTPRQYLDGQVYEIDLSVTGAENAGTAFDSNLFISVLLFSQTNVPAQVTWTDDVLPILQQYANLYPRPHGPVANYDPDYPNEPNPNPPLHPVVSLTDQAWVASYAPRILAALSLPIEHPNHMPVTRDLSNGRRTILETWMQGVIAGSIPLEPGPVIPPSTATKAAAAVAAEERAEPVMPSSKSAALARIKSGASASGAAE